MIEVLNLGAGVQSSTVLLMSLSDELPKLDHVVFADTGWESAAVYQQLDWLEQIANLAGIKISRVSSGNIRDDALMNQKAGGMMGQDATARAAAKTAGTHPQSRRWASMPYFVLGPNGEQGQIRRQCTADYKIQPIEQLIRHEILGLQPRQRAPKTVVVRRWYGISHDERQRMRISDHAWAENWYPLVEMRYTRSRCLQWMRDHDYPEPPRSACIGCPFHRNSEWLNIRENRPNEWREACDFDDAIRNCGGMRGQIFLHADRIPLREVSLHPNYDPRQMLLTCMADECSGMCEV